MDWHGWTISWLGRSPDLSPSDYFHWGYLKYIVYRNNPSILEELKSNISDGARSSDICILENVYRNLETWLSLFVRENGG